MTNVPKPDLERGAYIVYTDEPGEVLSPGSAGGGGAVYLELDFDSSQTPPYIPKFTYNDVMDNLLAGKFVYTRSVFSASGNNVVEVSPVQTAYDNGEDAYNVSTMEYRFTATDPDDIMTTYSE